MKHSHSHRRTALTIAAGLTFAIGLAHAGVEIHQTPLMVGDPVAPNIMFILDDSGSMDRQYMPDAVPNTSGKADINYRTSTINSQWYNPLVNYEPWLGPNGAPYKSSGISYQSNGNIKFAAAPLDPSGQNGTGTFDFITNRINWPSITLTTGDGTQAWRYSGFYVYTGSQANKISSYTRYEFRSCKNPGGTTNNPSCTTANTSWQARAVSLNDSGNQTGTTTYNNNQVLPWGRTVDEEIQNYVNWYSYYRTRMLMAKASASRVFAKLGSGYRVGYNTIWNRKDYKIPVTSNDGLFESTNRSDWFEQLFSSKASGNTPLHNSLKRTGDYFSDVTTSGPYGPDLLSCRQNFAILTTDGYWNQQPADTTGYMADNDSTEGPEHTDVKGNTYKYIPELPYKDGRGRTLADVAMYYWKTDLAPTLDNNVPTTDKNPAFWQHMRTYGISIGMRGTLDPSQENLEKLTDGTLSWPVPSNNAQANIDDLWHASINSRGEFIVANDPNEFTRALTSTLQEIASETKSEASGGVNTSRPSAGDGKAFFSRYTSGDWSGDLFAREIGEDGRQDMSGPLWEAENKLPVWQDRNIWVNNGGTFQKLTGAVTGLSADIANYLRGDQSKEKDKPAGVYRERTHLLPAFINSQLVYVGEPQQRDYFKNFSFSGAGDYDDYADAVKNRTPIIYIAGNNGMLHGFNANTGEEEFAFLTRSAIQSGKLQNYVQPNFGSVSDISNPHQYILDGELTVADAYMGGAWKTILVGTQGRAGSGIFALDVTDPADIQFLWEKNSSDTGAGALGNNLGKPLIAQVGSAGDWRVVLGNGPNSTGDKAQLITIKLDSGVVSAIDTGAGGNNGLSAPALWDKDKDGIFDVAYAGDLKGNLWKFGNLNGANSTPSTSFKLFTAAANQAISAAPLLVRNQRTDDTWVFVGTGRYLNTDDLVDTSQQAWYGLIDKEDGHTIQVSELLQRELEHTSKQGDVLESGTESEILYNTEDKDRGWYINFTRSGERMLMTPNYVLGGALFGFTFIPDTSDPCEPGGSSSLWAINPFTGGRLGQGIFVDDSGNYIKVGSEFISVLHDIPVVTSGSPPLTIGDDGTFTIQLPDRSISGVIPQKEPGRASWREVVEE